MGAVGDRSMSLPPFEHLPTTDNGDGSVGVDLSNLKNPDVTIYASVDCVARYCKSEKKELRVKVPWEYINFIGPLIQMGFDRIQHAESTYIVLREDKLQVASDVTLMQRENIASSSNPYNLISSQIPGGATLVVVPTPWETACEQDPKFQHSSQGFSWGPAGVGDNNEAAGLQGFSAAPEIPLQTNCKKRPHSADKSKRPSTRRRGPDFADEEKDLLLQSKLEYLQDPANLGKRHKWATFVSDSMKKKGFNRDRKAVQGQWDTSKKRFDALRRCCPQDTSYLDLTMDQKKEIKDTNPRKNRHFPLTFKPLWYVVMDAIEKMEPISAANKETRRDRQCEGVFSQSLASTITEPGSANFAGANNQASVQHPRQASAQGSDEDLLVDLQTLGAPGPSCTQDLSFLHSPREKDNQEIYATKQKQLAKLKELMESSSSDSLGPWDDAVLQYLS